MANANFKFKTLIPSHCIHHKRKCNLFCTRKILRSKGIYPREIKELLYIVYRKRRSFADHISTRFYIPVRIHIIHTYTKNANFKIRSVSMLLRSWHILHISKYRKSKTQKTQRKSIKVVGTYVHTIWNLDDCYNSKIEKANWFLQWTQTINEKQICFIKLMKC